MGATGLLPKLVTRLNELQLVGSLTDAELIPRLGIIEIKSPDPMEFGVA